MVGDCKNHPADTFIIVTKTGIIHRLQRVIPNRMFVAGPTYKCACNDCRYVKMNTVKKLRDRLVNSRASSSCPSTCARRPTRRSSACSTGAVSPPDSPSVSDKTRP